MHFVDISGMPALAHKRTMIYYKHDKSCKVC